MTDGDRWVLVPFRSKNRWVLKTSKSKSPLRCQVLFCRNYAATDCKKRKGLCHSCDRAQVMRNNPEWAQWYNKRRNAKLRRVLFDITYQQYCTLLETRPTPTHVLDRIDPTRGYIIGNIQWLTPHENNFKGATFDKEAWRLERIRSRESEQPNIEDIVF